MKQPETLGPITHMTSSIGAATFINTTLLASPHFQLQGGRGHSCCHAFQLIGGGAGPFRVSNSQESLFASVTFPFLTHTPHSVAVITLFVAEVQLLNQAVCLDSGAAEQRLGAALPPDGPEGQKVKLLPQLIF